MTAFCVIINNHLNNFYKWHCAINMDAVTNICIKVVPPSSDSTLIHISGFSVIPHFPLHAIHKKGFSTPLRSQAHYGGYGFATLTTSPYLRTFVRVSMVQKTGTYVVSHLALTCAAVGVAYYIFIATPFQFQSRYTNELINNRLKLR